MSEKLISKKINVEGMTCIACEAKIEKKLAKLNGIHELNVSYAKSEVTIVYDEKKLSIEEIKQVIHKSGYEVVEKKSDANFWIITATLIAGSYLIIKNTIGFNFIPEVDQSMGYGILFIIGVLTSLHCLAMCGGINLSVCMSYKVDQRVNGKYAKLIPSIMYNMGRVVSYTILGGVFGAFGSVISITNEGKAFVSILAGIFMVIMGINMLNIFPVLRKFTPHMPKVFAKKINANKSNKGPFIVGLLNGFMPCGPLQTMQIYALGTGSFLTGAISMFLFSLGTVPLMFIFGAIGSILSARFTKNMVKASAILVVGLGIIMLNRGVAFTGFTLDSLLPKTKVVVSKEIDNKEDKNRADVIVEDNVQLITTTLSYRGYTPITVEEGIPVKWTIIAEPGSINGCNNEIIIPEYGVQKKLTEGENIVEFTPTKQGKFGYSCWMGMIRSSITVLAEADSSINGAASEDFEFDDVDNTGLPAGCCGY